MEETATDPIIEETTEPETPVDVAVKDAKKPAKKPAKGATYRVRVTNGFRAVTSANRLSAALSVRLW